MSCKGLERIVYHGEGLRRLTYKQEVAGSSPALPTICIPKTGFALPNQAAGPENPGFWAGTLTMS
jgi:hypothetical protein